MVSGAFRTKRVKADLGIANLTVFTLKDFNATSFIIKDEKGKNIPTSRLVQNPNYCEYMTNCIQFRPTKSDIGTHTYTVYAVDDNGNRSADCLTVTLTIT